MGACSIGGSFYSTDWEKGIGCRFGRNRETKKVEFKEFIGMGGIEAIKEEARLEYGDDSYNGSASTCSFYYGGDYSKEKNIDKVIDEKMDRLGKRDGMVIKVETAGYIICTTDIVEMNYGLDFDTRYYLKSARKGPAVLLEPLGYGRYRIVAEGTVADLKKDAHSMLRRNNYGTYYYIVGRSKTYYCTYKGKFQTKTTRKSDDKNLVLPVNKYRYFGWAAE